MSPKSKTTFTKNDLMKSIQKTRGQDVEIKYISGYSDLEDYFKRNPGMITNKEWRRFFLSKNDNRVLVFFNPRDRTYNIALPATKAGHFIQVLNLREQLPLVTRFLSKETHEMITECPICFNQAPCDVGEYGDWVEGCVGCGALMCKGCVVKIAIGAIDSDTANYCCPFCRREDPVVRTEVYSTPTLMRSSVEV